MAAPSLDIDVDCEEELSTGEQCSRFSPKQSARPLFTVFYDVLLKYKSASSSPSCVLQQMARADPMTALLSPAVGGSMQSQMEAKLANMNLKSLALISTTPGSPPARTVTTSANPTLAIDSTYSFLSPDTPARLKAADNTAHRISAPALTSSTGERYTWAGVLGSSHLQSADFSGLSAGSTFRSPPPDAGAATGGLNGLYPVKTSSANINKQTTSLPPYKFRFPSKGHVHDGSSGSITVNNGVTNSGDDGDLIQRHHAPGVGRFQSGFSRGLCNAMARPGAQIPAFSNTSGCFGQSNDGSNAMAIAFQQVTLASGWASAFNFALGSLALTGMRMPNGLSMAQLAQLNGINPFSVNVNILGTANLSAMGITLEAQIALPRDDLGSLYSASVRASERSVGCRAALNIGIDDLTVPPPLPLLSSGGPAPEAPRSTMGGSAGRDAIAMTRRLLPLFKEELSSIEQCMFHTPSFHLGDLIRSHPPGFKVLSEAERPAALYSLLQHSTQVQIRFFIPVLQQMASAKLKAAGDLASHFCAGARREHRRAWHLGWSPQPGRGAGQLPYARDIR
ncbi:hypothetical protein EDB84DRAFT_1566597 [Lactarius hengduanensis]|nr:hypothetical protein EDB84DRAFT_1566597 [Lactarius hengduanensis]